MPLNSSKIPGGNELINAREFLAKIGIEEGMIVGDLGCGARGHFSLQAAKMIGPRGLVYAVDILPSALRGVEANAKMLGINNIKTVWADLEIYGATKIPKESLDLALLINILFQTKKDEEIIKEAVRLIKSGGKLVICDWKKTGAPFGPLVDDRPDPEELKKIVANLGLKMEKEIEAGPYHFALVFHKD
ncbi:MAG: class I SAM-dependent methyltransferase [Minisyncoccia bacterium]